MPENLYFLPFSSDNFFLSKKLVDYFTGFNFPFNFDFSPPQTGLPLRGSASARLASAWSSLCPTER